jgi:hypothetical protein
MFCSVSFLYYLLVFVSLCRSVFFSFCLFVILPLYRSVYLSFCPQAFLSLCRVVCLSISQPFCLSIVLSPCCYISLSFCFSVILSLSRSFWFCLFVVRFLFVLSLYNSFVTFFLYTCNLPVWRHLQYKTNLFFSVHAGSTFTSYQLAVLFPHTVYRIWISASLYVHVTVSRPFIISPSPLFENVIRKADLILTLATPCESL